MVAFNFKKGFVPDITHGIKCSTIRQTKRCNVGDVMQLYTGQRTKHCQKIADADCIGTAKIIIDSGNRGWVMPKALQEGVLFPNGQELHDQEGFSSFDPLIDFFDKHYGQNFEGWLHVWNPETLRGA